MATLKNKHVMSTHPEAFVIYESDGLTTLKLDTEKPAIVMREQDAAPYKGILKKDFQRAHKGEMSPSEVKDIENAFGMDINEFHSSMRTVGCGTTVFLSLSDGLHLLSVQRTAPSKTPEGVVMPGAFSRAAGGATGDIAASGYREFTEECFIGIPQQDNKIMSFDLVPDKLDCAQAVADDCLDVKHQRAASVFHQNNAGQAMEIEHHRVDAVKLAVPGLTQHVKQIIDQDEKLLEDYAVVDNPENGDLGGVDVILFASLENVSSTDLVLADGETDLDGNLLGRQWVLKKPEEWADMLDKGQAKFSPAYERVVRDHEKVAAAISKLASP